MAEDVSEYPTFSDLMIGLLQEGAYLGSAILIETGLLYLIEVTAADNIEIIRTRS